MDKIRYKFILENKNKIKGLPIASPASRKRKNEKTNKIEGIGSLVVREFIFKAEAEFMTPIADPTGAEIHFCGSEIAIAGGQL